MNSANNYDSPYRGSGQLTREQFLFYEMRTTAKLLLSGKSVDEIVEQIVRENLFQYPTERMTKRMARTCLNRLESVHSDALVHSIAEADSVTAKQACLYAMMKS